MTVNFLTFIFVFYPLHFLLFVQLIISVNYINFKVIYIVNSLLSILIEDFINWFLIKIFFLYHMSFKLLQSLLLPHFSSEIEFNNLSKNFRLAIQAIIFFFIRLFTVSKFTFLFLRISIFQFPPKFIIQNILLISNLNLFHNLIF